MDDKQRVAVIDALVSFTLRASEQGATGEEVAALPAIASLLLTIPFKG